MQKDKPIQSFSVPAGNRTYFIDVRTTTENRKYISLCESRRMPEGYHERNRILIFEEDVQKVVAALQATLEHFPVLPITGTKG